MYTRNNYISSPSSSQLSSDPLAYLEKKFNLTHEQVEKALLAVGGNRNAVEGFIQKNRGFLESRKSA